MPTIQIGMFPGRTLDQKRDLLKGVTQAFCDALGVDPDGAHHDRRERTSQHRPRRDREERLAGDYAERWGCWSIT
jgi:hypothetical protein